MKQFCKRGFSFLMSLCMLFTLIPAGAAEPTYEVGESVFDFAAAKYRVKENEGEISVKIVRRGDASGGVNVAVKAADFLAEYGKDYEVLLDGKPLSAQEGDVIDPSMFMFDPGQPVGETEEPPADTAEPVEETAEPVTDAEKAVTETTEPADKTEEAVTETTDAAETEEAAAETTEPADKTEEAVTETTEPAAEAEESADVMGEAVEDTAESVEEVSLSNDAAMSVATVEEGDEATPQVAAPVEATEAAEPVEETDEATEAAEPVAETDEATEAAEPVAEASDATPQVAEPVEEVEEATLKAASPTTYRKSNSPLLDAQRAYLQIPDDTENQQTQDALEKLTKDFHKFFEDAKGAQGIVYFGHGVTERVLTVRVIDNDTADGSRMFLMALLGTDSEKAAVALNNNAQVTIEDDEEYEPSTFSIHAVDKTLSVSKPTARVKITRTGGLQYFATAYVSTVTETALTSAYERMELREVGFIPGQTEAEITVTAKEFDGGTFGLRLETSESDFTREHYVTLTIEKQDTTTVSADDAQLMAETGTLGQASKAYGRGQSNSFNQFPGGWKEEKTGGDNDNRTSVGKQLYVANFSSGKHSMIVSNSEYELTGVKNIRFSMNVGGQGTKKTTKFGVAYYTAWDNFKSSFTKNGNMGWAENDVDVSGLKGSYYIKFGTQANAAGKHNGVATLDWFRFDYAKYTFDLQKSPANFRRNIYDFSQGAPRIGGIDYPNTDSQLKYPGAVKIEANGQQIGAFYANAEQTVNISAANSNDARDGFTLEGVYFVNTKIAQNEVYDTDKGWKKNAGYYVEANDNGVVSVKLGIDFVNTLTSKGVLSGASTDETIRIYPRYKQDMAKVRFENNDRPASAPKAYDSSHLASHFANILEAQSKETSVYWTGMTHDRSSGMDYYEIVVPKGSVIRVQSIPAEGRKVNGTEFWYWSGNTKHQYVNHNVNETAEIEVKGNLTMRPNTGEQTFYVGYFPEVTLPSSFFATMQLSGEGTESKPYTISSSMDWAAFCDALQDNDKWNHFTGKTVRLDADITVTRMAGSSGHEFSGTFDGNGHTVTVRFSSVQEYAAPFRFVKNGVIKNLNVTGNISTSAKYAGGIVSQGLGNGTLLNCRSSVIINSSVKGDGTHGGLIATLDGSSKYAVTGCVFDGSLLGANTTSCGGLVGWGNKELTFKDCLYAPGGGQEVSLEDSNTFARNNRTRVNSYYTRTLDPTRYYAEVSSITAGNGVTISYGTPVTTYDVSGITAYERGLTYKGVFYVERHVLVTLYLSGASAYTVSGGTLTKDSSSYDILPPPGNVTIASTSDTNSGRLPGKGTEGDPYRISSTADWDFFCDALQNNGKWNRFIDQYIRLDADISVTRMAGSSNHDFCGNFDGNGHTLTVNYTTTENGAAPFRYASEKASIQNLSVKGTINTSGKYAGGIVGYSYANLTLRNCRSSLTINSTISGDGTHGGLIGVIDYKNASSTITGCVFDGSIMGANTTSCGGFVGWNKGWLAIQDSLYNPANQTVSATSSSTFVRNNRTTFTNAYYARTLGGAQGKQGYTISPATNSGVSISYAYGSVSATYDVSGITAYSSGLLSDGVFYAGQDDQVMLALDAAAPSGSIPDKYSVNAGTLVDNVSFHLLTMPAQNVTVSATFKKDPGKKTLAYVARDISGTVAEIKEGVNVSDDSGGMWLANPMIGKDYSIEVTPPEGYYTFWTRMTGDVNNNGRISDSEKAALSKFNSTTKNSEYFWGNIINLKLDQDDTRYYYFFLPQVDMKTANRYSTGYIYRQDATLMTLLKDKNVTSMKPVANAYVNVAGQDGRTNDKGYYRFPVPSDLPPSGDVSLKISSNGKTYHSVAKLQGAETIVIPALENFSPYEISAYFKPSTSDSGVTEGSINSSSIETNDGELTITVAVTSDGTVIPTKAYFSLYHLNKGVASERFKLNWYDSAQKKEVFHNGYTVDYSTTSVNGHTTLYAKLKFNPRQDISTGDVLYVSFADQSGDVSLPLDIGYSFSSPLTLGEFIFGMIGSPALENAVTSSGVLDLIGDPLGNTDLGSVKGFVKNQLGDFTPPDVDKAVKNKYTYSKTAYTFGWAAEFSSSGDFDFNKQTSSEDAFDSFIDGLDDAKAGGGGGFSASGSYSFSITPEIGFRLTISDRKSIDDKVEGGHYFEDLVFYVKLGFDVSTEATISTPIYIDILIGGRLSGSMAGIYHMYKSYATDTYTDGLVPFDSKNFGLFKTYKDDQGVKREGYIFIDPQFDLKLGVGFANCFITGTAIFNFDLDFQFTEARVNAYGDIAYKMDFGIQAFGIRVYHKETPEIVRFKLFNTKGTNDHINFGYQVAQTLSAELMSAADEDITKTKPVDRSYLGNRSAWQAFDAVTLLDAEGSVEKPLREGTADNMQVQIVPINTNGDLLMVFVDDVPTRSTANKRAVYYSVYSASGNSWSNPAIIHDDGTPDDYPELQNLGNGKILAAWSSAERVMPDDVNLETMASAMNIEAAFFDATSRTFGESAVLTKTTEADYTADTMPHAAYDPETDRAILYYTKTQYSDMEKLSDYGAPESLIAYLFYEDGKWSNTGNAYTADELQGLTDAQIAEYKADWYGQRFLEARLNLNSAEFPRIVDTAAIGYNGLALFAYTVDWDNSLQTVNDRDVLLQIYNFSENSFTHIFRVTNATGSYSLPKLARSNNRTYLFYGEKQQGEDDDHGAIRVLDVSYILHNDLFERVTDGENAYYVLRGKSDPVTLTDSEGGSTTIPGETVDIVADVVTECDTLTDYDAFVADDGRMYLLWTDSRVEGEGRNIYAALFNTGDATLDGQAGTFEKEGQRWSEPVALTDGGENTYFSGLGTASVKDGILLVSAKGSYADTSHNSITQITHTPFSKLVPDGDLTFDNPYASAGQNVEVTATLKNPGLETFVPGEEGVRVTFQVNGTNAATEVYHGSIPGGSSVDVTTNIEVPEGNAVTISASCNGETVSTALERGARMRVTDENLAKEYARGRTVVTEQFRYAAMLSNDGNEPSGAVKLTVKSGETVLGEFNADAIQPGEQVPVDMVLEIPDSAWNINDEGAATLKADISARDGSKDFWSSNQDLRRDFDASAMALLEKVKSVKNMNVTINRGASTLLRPDIQLDSKAQGVDISDFAVEWQSSDNEGIAYIDRSNRIQGLSEGRTTLRGILVPSTEVISMNESGEFEAENWVDKIPQNRLLHVTAEVAVLQSADSEPGEPGEPGQPDSEPSYTVTFDSDGGSAVDSVTVKGNGFVPAPVAPTKDGYTFDDWYLNGQPYDFTAPVTGNITLQAKWTKGASSDTEMPSGGGTPSGDETPSGGSTSKKGCYVATSVYGSYDCPEVWTLRRFRDEVLADTWYGRLFIRAYYAVSPTAVRLFGDCEWFQNFWRTRLDTLVDALQSDGFESTPYDDPQW